MKSIFIKLLISTLFILLNLNTFAGYWQTQQSFIVGDDCLLTITFEVWWDDDSGDILYSSTCYENDCDQSKSFCGVGNGAATGYESGNFILTSTGTTSMSQPEMAETWDAYVAPWISTLTPPIGE